MTWKPMSSAPRDRTEIIVLDNHGFPWRVRYNARFYPEWGIVNQTAVWFSAAGWFSAADLHGWIDLPDELRKTP